MSVPSLNIENASTFMLLSICFTLGLSGSLHCVGMCGGLVTAFAKNKFEMFLYQVGRLLGYLLLGLGFSFIGQQISANLKSSILPFLFSGALGFTLIFLGLTKIVQNSGDLKLPPFLNSFFAIVWSKTSGLRRVNGLGSFFVGLFSLFLPCGLLYGVMLSLLALPPEKSLIGVAAFWTGTLPGMIGAPFIGRTLMAKLFNKRPLLFGGSLILIGLFTLSHRAFMVWQSSGGGHSCH